MNHRDIKQYYFSQKIAVEVGFEEAVMLHNIYFWINKNRKNKSTMHFHNGKYWTFNTVLDFVEQYPFWTPSMIKRILTNLKRAEYIDTGIFNKFGYDKTKWYTVTQKGMSIIEAENNN